jgi:primosomal protein N' (replication factor Y)
MIAKVVIDINVKVVDKTYDYLVPKELESIVEIGQRVIVSFGHRYQTGFIIELDTKSSFKELKPLYKIIDIIPLLSDEMIELGHVIRMGSSSTLTAIYQAMLPSGLQGNLKKTYSTTQPHEYKTLFNGKTTITEDEIEDVALLKKGLELSDIEESVVFKQDAKPKTEIILSLDINKPVNGKMQKNVIDYLVKAGPTKQSYFIKNLRVSYSTLKSLLKKGIIREDTIPVIRSYDQTYSLEDKSVVFSSEQKAAYEAINASLGTYTSFLLHGVTGSGKTEIYMSLMENVIKQGKQVLMLVPEIALTPLLSARIIARFKDRVSIIHSRLSKGERFDQFKEIKKQRIQIVIGARSAVFSPLENIGLIILDEAHTDAFIQDTRPRYDAVEVAEKRGLFHNCPVVLGTATPTTEQFYTAIHHKRHYLSLKNRVTSSMPSIDVVDMRQELLTGNRSMLSRRLKEQISNSLDNHEQVMILINRRGYSSFVLCRDCGEVIQCPNCDVSLTLHKNSNQLKCHYCGYQTTQPNTCPSCHSKHIRFMGTGTQQVEEVISTTFPNAKIYRMDADTTKGKHDHEDILKEFEENGDILIGTQMIAKGFDFERVTLVGVLAADMSLYLPSYQAPEQTFQLLTQIAGRSGRHRAGSVVIQTYNTDHYAIQAAVDQDYQKFYEKDIKIREIAQYPPIVEMVQVIIQGPDFSSLIKESSSLVSVLRMRFDSFTVLGPAVPKIGRIKNQYRVQILIKGQLDDLAKEVLHDFMQDYSNKLDISINYQPRLL